jgi:hypothetical protein
MSVPWPKWGLGVTKPPPLLPSTCPSWPCSRWSLDQKGHTSVHADSLRHTRNWAQVSLVQGVTSSHS